MANVKPTRSGSGLFQGQKAEAPHLLTHGLSKEVQDVRNDIAAADAPLAAITVDVWDGPGSGATLILGSIPKLRNSSVMPPFFEILDGVFVSPPTGTFALTGGNWVYTPATAVNASTAAVVTGTADMSAAALYGAGGTLAGLTLILTVNGTAKTITFGAEVNPTNIPAPSPTVLNPPKTLLDHINSQYPGLTATINGSNHLVLTDKFKGSTQSIIVGAGTANTALGLTPATTSGTGHSYAVYYEYDATQTPDATTAPQHAPYVNQNQGP